jgi:hypothetical protein
VNQQHHARVEIQSDGRFEVVQFDVVGHRGDADRHVQAATECCECHFDRLHPVRRVDEPGGVLYLLPGPHRQRVLARLPVNLLTAERVLVDLRQAVKEPPLVGRAGAQFNLDGLGVRRGVLDELVELLAVDALRYCVYCSVICLSS